MGMVRAGVIGHPVSHSLSPVMHNAAYRHLGLDWDYEAIDIEPGDVEHRVKELFNSGCGGLNVTMPHKDVAYEISTAHGAAARMRTVNTLIADADGKLHGYSTDGEGFISSLEALGVLVDGKRILVIGAGGASRAICDALVHNNAEVFVSARNMDQSLALVDAVLSGSNEGETLRKIDVVEFSDRNNYASECDIIVNATPMGMTRDGNSDDEVPLDAQALKADHIVIDTIYYPQETELLRQALRTGCITANGLGMLIHQGALSFKLMTGYDAPIDVMTQAIQDHLAIKSGD